MKRTLRKVLSSITVSAVLLSILTLSVSAATHPVVLTAYDSLKGSLTANGVTPWQGEAATRPKVAGSVSSGPIIPFGTLVTLSSSIPMYQHSNIILFQVEDLGDVSWKRYYAGTLPYYWLDIWQGFGDPNNSNDPVTY